MPNKYEQKRLDRENRLKEIPEETLSNYREILNNYLSKNRKKHYNTLRQVLFKRYGTNIQDEQIENILQDLYEYSWLNIEKVIEFFDSGYPDRYFNSLFYHLSTSKQAMTMVHRNYNEGTSSDGIDFPVEEDSPSFNNDALNSHLSTEERIEAHFIALDETKQWLLDNPDSKLSKCIRMTFNEYGQQAYDVALAFVATPAIGFLIGNYETLGLHHIQGHVNQFKRICSKVYGKDLKKGISIGWSKII